MATNSPAKSKKIRTVEKKCSKDATIQFPGGSLANPFANGCSGVGRLKKKKLFNLTSVSFFTPQATTLKHFTKLL